MKYYHTVTCYCVLLPFSKLNSAFARIFIQIVSAEHGYFQCSIVLTTFYTLFCATYTAYFRQPMVFLSFSGVCPLCYCSEMS